MIWAGGEGDGVQYLGIGCALGDSGCIATEGREGAEGEEAEGGGELETGRDRLARTGRRGTAWGSEGLCKNNNG
jgi:hypothetical protein